MLPRDARKKSINFHPKNRYEILKEIRIILEYTNFILARSARILFFLFVNFQKTPKLRNKLDINMKLNLDSIYKCKSSQKFKLKRDTTNFQILLISSFFLEGPNVSPPRNIYRCVQQPSIQ